MPLPGALRALCMVTFNQSHHPFVYLASLHDLPYVFIHSPTKHFTEHPSQLYCILPDRGQVTSPLFASFFFSAKWGTKNTCLGVVMWIK